MKKYNYVLFIVNVLLILFLTNFVSAFWNTTLNNGLIHYWTLDNFTGVLNSATDSISNHNISVFDLGGGSWSIVPAKYGYGFYTDGWKSLILNDTSLVPFGTYANVTISMWVNTTTAVDTEPLITEYASLTDWAMIATPGVANSLQLYIDGNSYTDTGNYFSSTGGNYRHLVWIRSGNNSRVYIDGVLVINQTLTGTTHSSELIFGGIVFRDNVFRGVFDEFAIWNKSLSDTLIAALNSSTTFENASTETPTININIFNPTNNSNYSISPSLNFSVINSSVCFYTVNNGLINYSANDSTKCINITTINSIQGQNNLKLYAINGTTTNSTTVSYFFDNISAFINITFPIGNVTRSVSGININYTIKETNATTSSGLANTTLYIYNQTGIYNITNFSYPLNTFSANVSVPFSLLDGIYTWFVDVFDNFGNKNMSSNQTITVNTAPPVITIIYPVTGTNYSINVTHLDFSISGTTANCWYSLDLGVTNLTFICSQNITGLNSTQGYNTWSVYVNNTVGLIGYNSTTFFIDSIAPNITQLFPTNNSAFSNGNITFNYTVSDNSNVNISNPVFSGLTYYWNLNNFTSNNQTHDLVNNNNLTVFDLAPGTGSWSNAPAKHINGFENDGGWKTLVINNTALIPFGNNTNFTISMWINTTSGVGDEPLWITYNSMTDWALIITPGAVNPGITIYLNGTAYTNSTNLFSASGRKFYHVVWVKQGNLSQVYVNGSIVINATNMSGETHHSPILLGGLVFRDNAFRGIIDEVGFWNRPLSQNEVISLYNSDIGIFYPSTVIMNGTGLTNSTLNIISSNNITVYQNTTQHNGDISAIISIPVILIEGAYKWFVSAFDLFGNQATTSNLTFIIDTTYPTIDYGAQTPGAGANLSRNYIFINVTVNETNEANISFNLYNGTFELVGNIFSINKTRTVTFIPLSNGEYYYNVTVCDIVNQCNSTETRNNHLDTNISVALIYPGNGTYINISNVNFTFNVSDLANGTGSEIYNTTLYIYNSTNDLVNRTTLNNSQVPNVFESIIGIPVTLIDGVYRWFVDAFDFAGNYAITANSTFTIDTQVPGIDYGSGTEANNTNFSRNYIFVNVAIIEVNRNNLTFSLSGAMNLTNILTSLVSNWNNNTFDNSLTRENLTFAGNQNITRYLSIPNMTTNITNAYLNLSGYTANVTISNGTSVNSTVYESQNTQDNSWNFGITAGDYIAQGIMIRNATFNLTNVSLSVWNNIGGGFFGTINVSIRYADNTTDNKPVGGNLANGNISITTVEGTYSWMNASFNGYPLYNNTNYSIVVSLSNFSAQIRVALNISGNDSYLYGSQTNSTTGIVWSTPFLPGDMTFRLYGSSSTITSTTLSNITNPILFINNTNVWNYTGNFNQVNNRTVNLASYINSYLATCTYIAGYCQVPFTFHSSTSGILEYSNMLFESLNSSSSTNQTYFNWTSLPNGIYHYSVKVCDIVNHCNSTSTRTITLDTTSPVVTQITPSGGYATSNGSGVYFNWSINKTNANITNQQIVNTTITIVNQSTGAIVNQTTINITNTGNWLGDLFNALISIPINLFNGIYNWFVTVVDSVGNIATTGNRTLIIDNSTSVINLISPIPYTHYYTNNSVNKIIIFNYTINSTLLDSCWETTNGVRININCSDKNGSLTLSPNAYNITLWANTTAGVISSASTLISLDNIAYISNAGETLTQSINLTLYGLTNYPNATAFYYNNINQNVSTIIAGGGTYIISSIFETPSNLGLIPFYFNWSGNQTDTYYQNISNVTLAICSGIPGTALALNFTTMEEGTFNVINVTDFEAALSYGLSPTAVKTITYSNLTNLSNYQFCISPPDVTLYIDGIVSYAITTPPAPEPYERREYIFSNNQINNNTQNINLFLMKTSQTDIMTFKVVNENDENVVGALIVVQRWDIGTNNFYTVGMTTSGQDGTASIDMRLNDAWYRQQVIYNGNVYLSTNPAKETTTSKILRIFLTQPVPYFKFDHVAYTFTYHNDSQMFELDYADTTGAVDIGCLSIEKLSGAINGTTIYNSCVQSSTGNLRYIIAENGTFLAKAQFKLTSQYQGVAKTVDQILVNIGIPERFLKIGTMGRAAALLLIGTLAMIGVASGSIIVGLVLVVAGVFFSTMIGLVNFSTSVIYSLIGLAIIIGFAASRRFG